MQPKLITIKDEQPKSALLTVRADPVADKSEILAAQNTVKFVFATLKVSQGMNEAQVGGLLTNKHYYLIMMCINGMKGRNYGPVIEWLKLIYQNIGKFIELLRAEQHYMAHCMDAIKCGLYSRNAEVCNWCELVFTKLVQTMNENEMLELKHFFVEWLTVPRQDEVRKSPARKKKEQVDQNINMDFLNEPGLQTMLRAYHKHGAQFIDQFVAFLVHVGLHNEVEMFTNQLRLNCQGNLEYLALMWDVTSTMLATEAGRKALVDSTAINVIIDLAFAIADNPALVNVQMNQPHELVDPPSERQRALMLLTEIWKLKPEVIQNELNQTRVADAILTVLKKGCRDSSRVISFVSIHLMADLLMDFSS